MKEEDYLILSGIQHFAFCRRQWALIHIEQQWSDNYWTVAGQLMHEKAHNDELIEKRGNRIIARGLRVSSATLGMTGQCDIVEFHEDKEGIKIWGYDGNWEIVPIEYKRGEPKQGIEDEVQLCAQAICLEEMFITNIEYGYLYYGENRHRVQVDLTEKLRESTRINAQEMHSLFDRGYTPKVRKSNKCRSCSLKDKCIPKLQSKQNVDEYIERHVRKEDGD